MGDDHVLSYEQRDAIRREAITTTEYDQIDALITLTGRATIAALAARSGVVVGRVLDDIACAAQSREMARDEDDCESVLREATADALRLALATAEARHAEREAMWRELRELECGYLVSNLSLHPSLRIDELRRALGLEGA